MFAEMLTDNSESGNERLWALITQIHTRYDPQHICYVSLNWDSRLYWLYPLGPACRSNKAPHSEPLDYTEE